MTVTRDMANGSHGDEPPEKKLYGTTQRRHGSIRRFRNTLSQFPAIRQQWHDFYQAVARDRARAWLESYRANPENYGPGPSLAEPDPAEPDAELEQLSGECRACEDIGFVTYDMLCFPCAQEVERDLLRMRDWDYSALAYGLSAVDREDLRKRIIADYGGALERLADPAAAPENTRRRHKRR